MKYIRPSYFLCLLLLADCASDKEFKPVYDVPEEFKSIVDAFIEEGNLRGHSLKITNLIIKTDPSMDAAVCGNCNSLSKDPNVQKKILINPNACWQSNDQKELLLFHELGHCFLNREHVTTLLPNNAPKSLMIPGDLSLYSSCVYAIDDECNKQYRRPYYLDELFNEDTPVPDWGK